jgi:putative OPT family oligopeptide transporter
VPIDTTPLRDPDAIAARDKLWLDTVYNGHDPQLTVRAAVTGMVLGAVLSISDLYIGLKIGWVFGMSITSSILGYALFASAGKIFPKMRPLTMLENNTSQTAASAAAYMAGAGLVSSIPALALLRREGVQGIPDPTGWQIVLFMLAISTLGVVVAVPLKRNMINAEQLRFPTGVVCAETIRTMHSSGKEALSKARSLFGAGVFAAAVKFIVECKLGFLAKLPSWIPFPGTLRGHPLPFWSLRGNTSLLLYAAGVVVGPRVTTSLLIGAIANYVFVGPYLLDHGVLRLGAPDAAGLAEHVLYVPDASSLYVAIRAKWSVWPGTAIVVAASLVSFAFRWRAVGHAFSSLARVIRPKASHTPDPLAHVEVPPLHFAIGLVVCTFACVLMQHAWFGVPILLGVVSVALAFILSIVAARVTGETNITPISALGKITQLLFGVLIPGDAGANLMTATVTAGAAAHSADLMTEVKTGYLLGGAPRKQVWAQLLGVLAGSCACVPIYFLLARPERLGVDLAAPSAVAWAAVAKLLKDGPSNLPKLALFAAGIGAAVGAVLAALFEVSPTRIQRWLPSATGIGIAFVIDANDSIAMFSGAMIALLVERFRPDLSKRYGISVASGIIAGEGLMGIAVIVMRDILHWLR